MKAIRHLWPEGRCLETLFHLFFDFSFRMEAAHLGAKGNVFEDAFRKRIRSLKNHPDPLSEGNDIRPRLINILSINGDGPFNPGVGDELVQTVERSEKSRFSASRRSDQRRDLALSDDNIDI